MKALEGTDLLVVTGGAGSGPSTAELIRENATTAVDTCGPGNVKSVSTTGFSCKG